MKARVSITIFRWYFPKPVDAIIFNSQSHLLIHVPL
jgi:hypothetical protein